MPSRKHHSTGQPRPGAQRPGGQQPASGRQGSSAHGKPASGGASTRPDAAKSPDREVTTGTTGRPGAAAGKTSRESTRAPKVAKAAAADVERHVDERADEAAAMSGAVALRADGTPDPNAVVPAARSRRSTERARRRATAAAEATPRRRHAEATGPFARITRNPAYRHVATMFPIFIVLAILATGYWGYSTLTAPKPSQTPAPTPTPISLADLAARFDGLMNTRMTAVTAAQQQVKDAGTDTTKIHAAYTAWHDADNTYANAIAGGSWQDADSQAHTLTAALQYEVGLLEKLETADAGTLDSLKSQLDTASAQVTTDQDAMRQALNPAPSASPGSSESAGPSASGSGSAEPSASGSESAAGPASASPSGSPSASASAS